MNRYERRPRGGLFGDDWSLCLPYLRIWASLRTGAALRAPGVSDA